MPWASWRRRCEMAATGAQEVHVQPESLRAKAAFVLIHGGGMGSWAWEHMVPHLAIPSISVDLPGRGSDAESVNDPTGRETPRGLDGGRRDSPGSGVMPELPDVV